MPRASTATGLTRRQRLAKRGLDLAVSIPLLALMSPLLALLAVLIRSTSPGPALYRHRRVGQGGRAILVTKFRTMQHARPEPGSSITVAGDPRITSIGRYLRSTKLDELPQLWDVVRGAMSLVGPRPDVPGYADRLEGGDAVLLTVRPGITGPAALYLRDEEDILARADDPIAYNDEILYPLKVRIDLDYVASWSFQRDLAYLAVTALPSLDRLLHVIPTASSVEAIAGTTGRPEPVDAQRLQ